jgi:hypothetical protein
MVGVALVLLALPLRGLASDSRNAESELRRSVEALKSGNLRVARRHQVAAQRYADEASETSEGLGARVWSWVPVVGGGVRDARHLVAAMAASTSAVGGAVEVYPQVMSDDGGLVEDRNIDLGLLDSVLKEADRVGGELVSARDELAQVEGDAPFLGAQIRDARDRAQRQIDPAAAKFERFQPMMDGLPDVLGASGPRSYMVMISNPAELRYSGGAVLTGTRVTARDGRIRVEEAGSLTELPETRGLSWPKVEGNVFHRNGEALPLQNATLNPNWSISGEEFLRGLQVASGADHDGLIVVDAQALARLLAVTNPIEHAVYGTLTADNFVKTVSGSYDTYPDVEQRRANNQLLASAFTDRLLDGGDFVDKFLALGQAAGAREFAMYLRPEGEQRMIEELGVSGDLHQGGSGDYFSAQSQNTNISKVDYYQRRDVTSNVRLRADGSAEVDLQIVVHNDTPPYVGPEPDPRIRSYQTRWAGLSLAAFLPERMHLESMSLDGKQVPTPHVGRTGTQSFVRQSFTLAPGASATMRMRYTVPDAARVSGDELVYSLSVDPQGLVTPAALDVSVRVPKGYAAQHLPEGWRARGNTLRYVSQRWEQSASWSLPLQR